ncbi:MAG: diacylglycerol kinase family lipid kinase [Nitrospirae bacterium]|nr:diacylglycerol kinase family lipid kinase [Nitrospirota bacterium]
MNYQPLNVRLIANPIAGRGAPGSIKRAVDLLKDKVSLSTFITQKKGDAESFARQISSEFAIKSLPPTFFKGGQGGILIIVAGGDGTINEVINGLLASGISDVMPPVALLPFGTTNVLAKELGIPEDIEQSLQLALAGSSKKISLGRIVITRDSSPVTRYFCLMAGIGFDGAAVHGVKDGIKKISGKGAYILSGISHLAKYSPPLIKVKTSTGLLTGYTAVVGKARCYGGYFSVTPKASITEPKIDLCLFGGKTRRDLIRFVNGVVSKNHLNFSDVFYGKFTEMEIVSDREVHVQTDGDYFGTLPLKIDVVQDALSVVW